MFSVFILHGAGAGHNSPFLKKLNQELELELGVRVTPITFNYMKQMEAGAPRRPPPSIETLVNEVVAELSKHQNVILIGKSMGARVALEVAKKVQVRCVVALGFPFYPQGRPEKNRLIHFSGLPSVPVTIFQGDRDKMGDRIWFDETAPQLSSECNVEWVVGADHDFKVLKRLGLSEADVRRHLIAGIVQAIKSC